LLGVLPQTEFSLAVEVHGAVIGVSASDGLGGVSGTGNAQTAQCMQSGFGVVEISAGHCDASARVCAEAALAEDGRACGDCGLVGADQTATPPEEERLVGGAVSDTSFGEFVDPASERGTQLKPQSSLERRQDLSMHVVVDIYHTTT
jgi:hypothetical protein